MILYQERLMRTRPKKREGQIIRLIKTNTPRGFLTHRERYQANPVQNCGIIRDEGLT